MASRCAIDRQQVQGSSVALSVASMIADKGTTVAFMRRTVTKSSTLSRDVGPAEVVAGSPTRGWLQPYRSDQRDRFMTRGLDVWGRVYVETDPLVKEGDWVEVNGEKFAVVETALDQAGIGQVWRVDVRKMK